jgi:YidC/Oxa1 family membrane protein insertase
MDKNTIIGFVLIALILIGFSVMNKPSEEEIRYQDSIALVQKQKYEQEVKAREAAEAATVANNTDSKLFWTVIQHVWLMQPVISQQLLLVKRNFM